MGVELRVPPMLRPPVSWRARLPVGRPRRVRHNPLDSHHTSVADRITRCNPKLREQIRAIRVLVIEVPPAGVLVYRRETTAPNQQEERE
jgi:hypothetical protein